MASLVTLTNLVQTTFHVAEVGEHEYTTEQFQTDLAEVSVPLAALREQALKDHREGKTRKFPK